MLKQFCNFVLWFVLLFAVIAPLSILVVIGLLSAFVVLVFDVQTPSIRLFPDRVFNLFERLVFEWMRLIE